MSFVLLSGSLPVSAFAGESFGTEVVALEESIPEEVLDEGNEFDDKNVVLIEGFEDDLFNRIPRGRAWERGMQLFAKGQFYE